MDQIDIFELLMPKYKITKPVRLIELFAGIGSQLKSLKRLQKKYRFKLESYRVVEFDKCAIASYNAINGTDFVPVDITKINADDLGIENTDKYEYILTYSFPCQDLSLAGKRKGMKKNSGTRSGLLWEVERLLDECGELPQILLMENVPQVISSNNMDDFRQWQLKLEKLGYTNYVSLLNAKDYGIPQNRNRCFMISFLGQYSYKFPKPFKLKTRLRDLLENEVDEKYYLNDSQIKKLGSSSYVQNQRRLQKKDWCDTLCARDWKDPKCVQVGNLYGGKWDKINESSRRVYSSEGKGGNTESKIVVKEATKQSYTEATEGDSVNLEHPNSKTRRGRVGKQVAQTLTTSCNQGVVVDKSKVIIGSTQKNAAINHDGICPALTSAMGGGGGHIPMHDYKLRVRKLTPLECWRLMGFDDEDFYKAKKINSNTQLYKQAGNSIVVDVLEHIFNELF